MNNLRDRGYPQAKTERVNKSDKQNAIFRVGIDKPVISKLPDTTPTMPGSPMTRREKLAQGLVAAYNNRAFGNPNMPLIQRTGVDYVDDDNVERAYMSGYALRDRNNNRLAFTNKDVRSGSTGYYAGIDNLPFGDNVFSKSIDTPLGTFGADYDGDGTASISYESSPNVYYLQALAKALLSRGTL